MVNILQTRGTDLDGQKYSNWAQLAGYFDGDGTVGLDVQLFTLGLYLEFTDNWEEQLRVVEEFLSSHDVTTYRPGSRSAGGAWTLKVLTVSSVVKAAKEMLPFVAKKQTELNAIVAYYEDRSTAQDVVEIFNQDVIGRKRVGKIRRVSLPYLYSEGRHLAMEMTRRMASQANSLRISDVTKRAIVEDRLERGMSQNQLAVRYGVSRTVIRRVLGAM